MCEDVCHVYFLLYITHFKLGVMNFEIDEKSTEFQTTAGKLYPVYTSHLWSTKCEHRRRQYQALRPKHWQLKGNENRAVILFF